MISRHLYSVLLIYLFLTSACPFIHKPLGDIKEYGRSLRIDLCEGVQLDEYICSIAARTKTFEVSGILITNPEFYRDENFDTHTILEFSIEPEFLDSVSQSVLIVGDRNINGTPFTVGSTSYFEFEIPINFILKDENPYRFDFIIEVNGSTLEKKTYKVSFF